MSTGICEGLQGSPDPDTGGVRVRVTINTDDLLIFDSTIENEYLKLYRAGTLSVDQLDEIRRAGLGSGGRP